MKEELVTAIAELNEEEAMSLVHSMLDAGEDPQVILNATSEAMRIIGSRFDEREYFLPELIIAGDLMKQIAELVKPRLATKAATTKPLGKIVLGTVAGDIHDIGKDVVGFMLDANGFEVHDLGVDVSPEAFVKADREGTQIIGLSALLTTTMPTMVLIIEALKTAGLRDKVKVMVGGAPVTQDYANKVGADAFAPDASSAVRVARGFGSQN